ncbi:MAG TPA: alpha/beta hydrolase [Microbacteriaceae bacterium]|nr:alpha/beta hydrolase [Microbacteriaceae bacterium]
MPDARRDPQARGRRGIRALAVFATLAAATLLTACVGPATRNAPSMRSTPTGEHVSAALAPYYHQTLLWAPCGTDLQCTHASVPLDWAHPAGAHISLALIRHPATGQSDGDLLVNPGGPGGSGVDFVRDSLASAVDATVERHFTVIGFDPRGVGASTPVKCLPPSGLDHYLYGITPGTPGSATWITASIKEATTFADACRKNTGPLLAHVDTASAARDMDVLRAALGQKKLDYLGYSYGTYLGTVYAGLFPGKVGRFVLDGALDPASTNFDVTLEQAKGFERALTAYLTACIGTKGCPFTSVTEGLGEVRRLLAQVTAHPLHSGGRALGANTLVTAIIYPLYDANAWSLLNRLFTQVRRGDAAFAFTLADAYNERQSDGSYKDNSAEAFTAINCLDYHYDDNVAHMRAQAARLEKAAPVIGRYLAYGDISCAVWPYRSTVHRGPIHAAGAAPIVVVGTTGDPATPYAWAKALASQLDSGRLITYRGQGHTAYNKSNACVDDAVDDYLTRGTLPRRGLTC